MSGGAMLRCLIALFSAWYGVVAAGREPNASPNFVVLFADDMGYGKKESFSSRVKPVTIDHPSVPPKAVFTGRWSLVGGLHRTATMWIPL